MSTEKPLPPPPPPRGRHREVWVGLFVVAGVLATIVILAVMTDAALVDAIRSHGHLAARLDPLGSEPLGDPALEESELAVPLPPDVQARIPASARVTRC